MSQLIPFHFDAHNVRVQIDASGNPWWVVADVCEVLGIENSRDAFSRISDTYKGVGFSDTLGGKQPLTIVNEPGLYELIFRSNKPEAKRFRQWVFTDVLPQIRKTGRYEVAPTPPAMVFPPELTQALAVIAQGIQALMSSQSLTQQTVSTHTQALAVLDDRVTAIEKQDKGTGYMTLLAYARVKGFHLALSEARRHGQALRKRASVAKVNLGEAPDERWGKVNTYPIELLDEYFSIVIEAEKLL